MTDQNRITQTMNDHTRIAKILDGIVYLYMPVALVVCLVVGILRGWILESMVLFVFTALYVVLLIRMPRRRGS